MAGRYLVTGVQLGMLLAINSKEEKEKIINNIIEEQFIANSGNDIKEDCKIIGNIYATTTI